MLIVMFFINQNIENSINQEISDPILEEAQVTLSIKREDLISSEVSGNKYRKLKYNLIEAQNRGVEKILTFGGAYSNHIRATAKAAQKLGLQSIGIIRGEELGVDVRQTLKANGTLRAAVEDGMHLAFVSRKQYQTKTSLEFVNELKDQFGEFYLIPEGGTNELAIKGCQEILLEKDTVFDVICCAVGTGGTISGIINSTRDTQHVLGFPALKGDFLNKEITRYTVSTSWELCSDYHFGGYGKVNDQLVSFINNFKKKHNIALDPIYTGKMLFGIFDLIKQGFFMKNTRILAIHTGGVQGISGINQRLEKRNQTLIDI